MPAWSALDYFFTMNAVLPGMSVLAYWFVPDGTITHFGGEASATARTWMQVMASGDLLCAWLSFKAIRAEARMQRLAIEGIALYSTFHVGAFLWGHYVNEVKMPKQLVGQNMMAIPIPFLVWLWASMKGGFRIKAD